MLQITQQGIQPLGARRCFPTLLASTQPPLDTSRSISTPQVPTTPPNGYQSLYSNNTGNLNTAYGYQSLYSNSYGESNTAIGYQSLYSNATGHFNTALGFNAHSNVGNYHNSMGLGYDADPMASNRVHVGNSSVAWIGGQVGWSTYSDSRFKTDISDDVKGLEFISKLNPVTYNYDLNKMLDWKERHYGERDSSDYKEKYEIESYRFSGFLAQEVEAAALQVGYDFSGMCPPKHDKDFYSLRYSEFVVPLVKAVQELADLTGAQQTLIEILKGGAQKQQGIINGLRSELNAMKEMQTEMGALKSELALIRQSLGRPNAGTE